MNHLNLKFFDTSHRSAKKMRIAVIIAVLLIVPRLGSAQEAFPKNYFRNPLDIPIVLSGGFAECRPDHFHTGIDIKTQQRENLPVHAAADGYVSRISISSTGYGNAIYIQHPNGYTTVYGHLNKFNPELQQYLEQQQYEKEQWAVELYPPAHRFPVKKGEFIAYSGTTGGSTGPHLHFEIRDTKTEHVLNELLFGLPVKDTRPPKAEAIAVYDASISIYEQAPVIIKTKPEGSDFTIQHAVFVSNAPSIMVGVAAKDYTNNSHNWLGIYQMKLFLDGALQLATRFTEIDFALNRYVNAYADYKTKQETGIWYQGLYRLPNNRLPVYPYVNSEGGALDISDGATHNIRIELSDPFGNVSQVKWKVRYNAAQQKNVSGCTGEEWSYADGGILETPTLKFTADTDAFYDDICFTYQEEASVDHLSNKVQLADAAIPIQSYCRLRLKLNRVIPEDLHDKLIFVHHIRPAELPGKNPRNGMAVSYDAGWVVGNIRSFGNYYVAIDTTAPRITPLQSGTDFSTASRIRFEVKDRMTTVRSFRGTINGAWVCFSRDKDTYTYYFDRHCPKGENTLTIVATDENDNKSSYTVSFKR